MSWPQCTPSHPILRNDMACGCLTCSHVACRRYRNSVPFTCEMPLLNPARDTQTLTNLLRPVANGLQPSQTLCNIYQTKLAKENASVLPTSTKTCLLVNLENHSTLHPCGGFKLLRTGEVAHYRKNGPPRLRQNSLFLEVNALRQNYCKWIYAHFGEQTSHCGAHVQNVWHPILLLHKVLKLSRAKCKNVFQEEYFYQSATGIDDPYIGPVSLNSENIFGNV